MRSEQGCHATKAKALSYVALGPVCPVESYSIGVYNVGAVHHEGHEGKEGDAHRPRVASEPAPDVGFALLRLNLNVADKLRTLQKRDVACVALGPVPNVVLVGCALTYETDVACVAL